MKTPAHFLTRRQFVRCSSAALAAAALPACAMENADGFTHRALNGWITDLATEPDAHAAWPSMRLDEKLLADYREMFALMRRVGFNEIAIWGLYTANNWPVDLPGTVVPERGWLVERLISDAHAQGIKVISGLGTYSWGFAEIIRAHPQLNGGNANAMCASEPQSHAWMERVLDFVFTWFAIDGVSMQSADQGRCKCARCAKLGDAAYHALLLARTAQTIRARWPGKIVGMSNWGVSFGNPRDRETFAELSRSFDYMIDYNDSARGGGAGWRREFIAALGTTGGLVVEPPQHWARDRWFLPTCRRGEQHLQKFHADGGRACEFFDPIAANPSSELTPHVAGHTLSAPTEPLEKHLYAALDELYAPRDAGTRAALAHFFLDAEHANLRHLPAGECGTLSLEPLTATAPAHPSTSATASPRACGMCSKTSPIHEAESMKRHLLTFLASLVGINLRSVAADMPPDVRATLEIYCFDCHDDATHRAKLSLETLIAKPDERTAMAAWTCVHDPLAECEMPPAKKPQPTAAERRALTD